MSDVFPASEETQGQKKSRSAYQKFLDELTGYSWWQDYLEIVDQGWSNWRIAVYIAWASSPVEGRVPSSQAELASGVLGLKSDRSIRKWREKQPEIDETIAAMQSTPLMRYRRDVFEALATSAMTPDSKNAPDRRTFLTMTGDLKAAQSVELTGKDGGPVETENVVIYMPDNGRAPQAQAGDDDDDGDSTAAGTAD